MITRSLVLGFSLILVSCGGSGGGSKDSVDSKRSQSLEITTNYSSTSTQIKLSSLLQKSMVDCGLEVGPEEVYDFEVKGSKIKLTDSRQTSITFKVKPGTTDLIYILDSSSDPRVKAAELEMPNSRTIRLKMECEN